MIGMTHSQSEEYLARKFDLLRIAVDATNSLITLQLLPAINGLGTRLREETMRTDAHATQIGELNARVTQIEEYDDDDEPRPPHWPWLLLTALAVYLLAVASSYLIYRS